MTQTNVSSQRIFTAALVVIGDEILSGRTPDKNIAQVALWANGQGIRLRAYAQTDPVIEYKREGFDMFEAMNDAIKEEIVRRVFLVRLKTNEEIKRQRVAKVTGEGAGGDKTVRRQPVVKKIKVGPNDPCPCGSGKKYKKCCRDKDLAAERGQQTN